MIHQIAKYIQEPLHPVSIAVVGAGGNGSQIMTQLCRINLALIKLRHKGLHITLIDGDNVSETNVARQAYLPQEIGLNKAFCLISRINRTFGFTWEHINKYVSDEVNLNYNIIISCVDSIASRKRIDTVVNYSVNSCLQSVGRRPYEEPYYHMDIGNGADYGQIILGNLSYHYSSRSDEASKLYRDIKMKTFFEEYGKDIKSKKFKEEKDTPSCSFIEAITKQDLFINSILAQYAAQMIWKILRDQSINYRGVYVNTARLNVKQITI